MKRFLLTVAIAALSLSLLLQFSSASTLAANRNFAVHLSGDQQVPPVDTNAQGEAIFHLSKDGTMLDYKLIVANIDNVTASHIHLGAPGTNGPVVAFLYGGPPIQGTFSGVLAEGTITAADLKGPLAGMSLSDLLTAMESGNTYVNVHTTAHPGGEIRGNIH